MEDRLPWNLLQPFAQPSPPLSGAQSREKRSWVFVNGWAAISKAEDGTEHIFCRLPGCKKKYRYQKGSTSNLVSRLREKHLLMLMPSTVPLFTQGRPFGQVDGKREQRHFHTRRLLRCSSPLPYHQQATTFAGQRQVFPRLALCYKQCNI